MLNKIQQVKYEKSRLFLKFKAQKVLVRVSFLNSEMDKDNDRTTKFKKVDKWFFFFK